MEIVTCYLPSVWVCYNQGPPVAVEIEDEAQVLDLKREVGDRLGVQSERLRVLFAGRELHNEATLKVKGHQGVVHAA